MCLYLNHGFLFYSNHVLILPVNISSIAGNRALPNHLVYCASKSALQMMGHCMAMEFGKHKVGHVALK